MVLPPGIDQQSVAVSQHNLLGSEFGQLARRSVNVPLPSQHLGLYRVGFEHLHPGQHSLLLRPALIDHDAPAGHPHEALDIDGDLSLLGSDGLDRL